MTSQLAKTLIDDLIALEPPKTWSLVVTIFGDLVSDSLTGKNLGTLLGHMNVKPEAIRVAMHRLKRDGWIIATMSGREVTYKLSEYGQSETMRVQKDIYRKDVKFSDGWRVIVTQQEMDLPLHAINLSKNIMLLPLNGPVPDDGFPLSLVQDSPPTWIQDQIVPAHLTEHAGRLLSLALRFKKLTPINSTQEATARLLFLHYWRKLALRDGTWAHIGLVPDGILAQCHRAVTEIIATTEKLETV